MASAIVEAEKARVVEAAPIVADLLRSRDPAIRASAAEALSYVGIKSPSRYGAALLPLLRDPERLVRSCAAESLGVLAYESAIPDLGRLLVSDADELVRASAAEALAAFDGSQILALARRAINDPDPTVRAYAARIIGVKGDQADLLPLSERLEAEDALQPRAELLGARYMLGAREDLRRLLDLLVDADVEQSTVLLNVLWDVLEELPKDSIVRDAAVLNDALSQISARDGLVGRHANKVAAALAKRLGASPN